MEIVDEDKCRNPDFVPNLPPVSMDPTARLDAFRLASNGRLAVRYMLIALADDAFEAPAPRRVLKSKFVEYFGEGLDAEKYDAAEVFDNAFHACLSEQLIFGTEDAGFFGGFRPSRRP
ncbi:hypothetical protein [Mycobacterium malmoense]|uniref:hypothetical protein n=1 Tax=Mycobacterium malmoense TaxID=1780 RepID=UPI0011300899|nr:hypothetical protein [Mycobacterium malmoense]